MLFTRWEKEFLSSPDPVANADFEHCVYHNNESFSRCITQELPKNFPGISFSRTDEQGIIIQSIFRANRGYFIAPPSGNGNGKNYTWMRGLSIFEVPWPELPGAYLEAIGKKCNQCNPKYPNVTNLSPNVTNFFEKRHRDNTLFHIANCLLKGGMPASEAEEVLNFPAKNCSPAYLEKDVLIKIASAKERISKKEI
ncbi:MAG: hypothetical protein JRI22_03115 [Deltaproteobacteria bacterium]|nr:hypothetical protein [Deltaproteobacteria bacterium]